MKIDIYCDESRQDLLVSPKMVSENNKYCCIGGIMVPADWRADVKSRIQYLREEYAVYGEVKWTTVSKNKLQFYLALVDLFFTTPGLTFRTVVIDASRVHNDLYNQNDQELGYYKFYYQLLHRWLLRGYNYRIFTDQKTNGDKQRLKELRRILNVACQMSDPVDSIQAIDSRESVILQLQNILMGAVGYRFNYPDGGESYAKNQVVLRIEEHIGHKIQKTYPSESKFNIFVINLREEH